MTTKQTYTSVIAVEAAAALVTQLRLQSEFVELIPYSDELCIVKTERKIPLGDNPDFDNLNTAELGEWYEKTVGYNPLIDDPTMSHDSLLDSCKGYVEAIDMAP